MWNIEHSIASEERGEHEARSTNLTHGSLQQTCGLTRPAGLVLVLEYIIFFRYHSIRAHASWKINILRTDYPQFPDIVPHCLPDCFWQLARVKNNLLGS